MSDIVTIQNRKGHKIVVEVWQGQRPELVFILHGLGSHRNKTNTQAFAEAFKNNGFNVVLFDATNSFGESGGSYENATITNHFEDLEDVIKWSKSQPWYTEPFWLVGHSLGGIAVSLYAIKYPGKIKALAPISTVVSGQLSKQSPIYNSEVLANWEQSGWLDKGVTETGAIKRLPWSHMEDRMKYDLLTGANSLTMPTLMIVGTEDTSTPPPHQKLLFDALPAEKEFHLIEGAPHSFKDPKHLEEIKAIFDAWIKKQIK